MNIKFTDYFNSGCKDKFHIAPSSIREAVSNPNDSQEFTFKGLNLLFVTKQLDKYTLLTYGRKNGDQLIVDFAFKIMPDLIKGVEIRRPVDLLQKFIALKVPLEDIFSF